MAKNSTSRTINWAHYQVSLVVGAVILPVSICAYCVFLFSLKRGTPMLWPYAAEVVDEENLQIEPVKNAIDTSIWPEIRTKQWHITLKNEEYYLETQEAQRLDIEMMPGNTPDLSNPDFHQSTVSGTTIVKLDKNQYLLIGGIEEPLTTSRYSNHDISYATNRTWFSKDFQLKSGPSMSFPRAYPHHLQLANGNILVTGGVRAQIPLSPDFTTKAAQAIEEYAPKQKRFILRGQMQIPRYEHSVCQLKNGNFLIVSGRTNHHTSDSEDNLTASIEIFSPKTKKSWIVGQLHNAMAKPVLLPLKDGRVAIFDRTNLAQSYMFSKPYLEIFTGTQVPIQKLPHLPSIAEMLHSLMFWKQ